MFEGANRTCYDINTRRLTFIMPDQAATASRHVKSILFRGKRLQILCPAIMEREDISYPSITATSASRNVLHYQVRVLVNIVAVNTVYTISASIRSCKVTSVNRGCKFGSDAYDSSFPRRFPDTVAFPKKLQLFTHISNIGGSLSPSLSALSTHSLFYPLFALSFYCQVHRAQRHISNLKSFEICL